MIAPVYESYKDSGVEWLGQVPSHWQDTRLRYVAELNPSKSEAFQRDREEEVSFIPMEAVGEDGTLRLDQTRPIGAVETGYTYFAEGDVTVAKITPCFENGKGAVMRGLVGGIGFGTTELIVARPRSENSSDFINWLFSSTAFRKLGEGAMYGAGGQKRVPDEFVRNFRFAIPPISEQTAIAAFLDRETGKIDTLIQAQTQLIELLGERISSLAMQGGDHQWIKLKQAVDVIYRPIKIDPDAHYTRLGLYNRGRGVFHKPEVLGRDIGESDFFAVEQGDLIISGQFAWEGSVAIAEHDDAGTVVSHRYPILRGRPDVMSTHAIFAILTSQYGNHLLNENSRGSAGRNRPLNLQHLLKDQIPLLSKSTQESIEYAVKSLTKARSELDRLQILLLERRVALISAAVTGKIDVRGLVNTGREAA